MLKESQWFYPHLSLYFVSQVTGNPALVFWDRHRSDLALYQLSARHQDAHTALRLLPDTDTHSVWMKNGSELQVLAATALIKHVLSFSYCGSMLGWFLHHHDEMSNNKHENNPCNPWVIWRLETKLEQPPLHYDWNLCKTTLNFVTSYKIMPKILLQSNNRKP